MTVIWAGEDGGSSSELDSGGGSKPGSLFRTMGELNVGDGAAAVVGDDSEDWFESSEGESGGGAESECVIELVAQKARECQMSVAITYPFR
jgi:hypothetical protein